MSRLKLVKAGSKLMTIGIILYIVQNCYFGWNEKAMSEAEEIVDLINKIVLYLGGLIYLIPVFALYENWVEELEK